MACPLLSMVDCTMGGAPGHGNELSNSFLDFAANFAASVNWPFVAGWLFATAVFLTLYAIGHLLMRADDAELRHVGEGFAESGIKAVALAVALLVGFAVADAVRP